jgi:hypothetical protein
MNPDTIYYNAQLVCRKNLPTDPDIPCIYTETRTENLLNNAMDYKFSIIRFTLDSVNIPVFIPQIQGGINQTIYQVQIQLALNLNGTITNYRVSQPLQYVCRNKYASQVPSVAGADSPYYYMFDLQDFCDMFNTSMSSLFSNLNAGISPTVLNTKPPKMTYQNNLFSIWYDANGWGGADATGSGAQIERFTMQFNEPLRLLLRNFNMTYQYDTVNGIYNWNLLVSNKLTNNQTVSGKLYYVETQSYETTSTIFSPVSSIVFISNAMGIRAEYLGSTQVLSQQVNSTQSSNDIENSIADISLPLDNSNDYNSCIAYQASVFRYSEIFTESIRDIDIKLFWKSKMGFMYPIMLSDGCGMNLKMMFERKR